MLIIMTDAHGIEEYKDGYSLHEVNQKEISRTTGQYVCYQKYIKYSRMEDEVSRRKPAARTGWIQKEVSMTEHIPVINQLKEKCREYNIPFRIARKPSTHCKLKLRFKNMG